MATQKFYSSGYTHHMYMHKNLTYSMYTCLSNDISQHVHSISIHNSLKLKIQLTINKLTSNLQYIHLMKYDHENEQSTNTQNNIYEYYYHSIDRKKPKQKRLYWIISFIKMFRNRQNKSMLLEVRMVVIFGSIVTEWKIKGYLWSCFISGSVCWLHECG